MKLSCLPISLFKALIGGSMTLGDWAGAAPGLGLDGIDISIAMIQSHSPVYLKEIRSMIGSVPVVMATAYPDFTHPDPWQRQRELDYFVSDTALCSQLGIRYLRILDGQAHTETSRENGIKWALDCMRRADDTARRYGVSLLFENHSKPSAWEHFDFSYPIDLFYAIMDGLKDTGIHLNFDIGNITSLGLDPLNVLSRVYDRVETIHVSDMAEVGKPVPCAIGTGAAPISGVFSLLKNRGFDGWLCIEEASGRGLPGIAQAASYVRGAWEKS
jgi:sugar phosphate isomerase/epimerase